MSDGDDESEETPDSTDETAEEQSEPVASPEELDERLDEVEAELEAAETEADLDEVEAELDRVEKRVETLPEPEEDAEEDPKGDLEDRIGAVRDGIEDQRGPYGEDVAETLETAAGTVRDTRWTDTGESEVREAVETRLAELDETLDGGVAGPTSDDLDAHADAVEDAAEAVRNADLDADDDEETIASLLESAEGLQSDLDDAQEWDDLTVREQLDYNGFYDVLTGRNRKDFPPELSVVRIAEREKNPEPILTALDTFESEFMQENCMMALKRLGSPEAYDEMNERAQRRKFLPIEVLGKIGDPRALDTLLEFIEGDANPPLQRVVLRAVGSIGDEEATQTVADRLVADDPEIRSGAARALGQIGDPRAIDPLTDLLNEDDDDSVRTSAAWALNRIGTEEALEAASEHADDRSYIVQTEAEKAQAALSDDDGERAEPTA
ncbi:HEAT repeat domain-containing protein [Halomarina salina]|uniref:HEAT repeat domain-containing protein n=1 Tax=Halomarina salina TaxID=1872699 RepID=A0ABD5RIT0_9EURY|nr:HEAT repeat domain-containing protein [Halomarina salina]